MDVLAIRQHLDDARDAVGDPRKMVGSIANRAQRILDSIAAAVDLIEDGYVAEHTRPETVTVGARRALESIRDMTVGWEVDPPVGFLERIHAAAQDGLASIEQAALPAPPELSDEQADRILAMIEQPDYEPQIEVLPLPGDRFMLVFSSWPTPMPEAIGVQIREQSGAAAMIVARFPVHLPGARTWDAGK
jgi:hypothetical protein